MCQLCSHELCALEHVSTLSELRFPCLNREDAGAGPFWTEKTQPWAWVALRGMGHEFCAALRCLEHRELDVGRGFPAERAFPASDTWDFMFPWGSFLPVLLLLCWKVQPDLGAPAQVAVSWQLSPRHPVHCLALCRPSTNGLM